MPVVVSEARLGSWNINFAARQAGILLNNVSFFVAVKKVLQNEQEALSRCLLNALYLPSFVCISKLFVLD